MTSLSGPRRRSPPERSRDRRWPDGRRSRRGPAVPPDGQRGQRGTGYALAAVVGDRHAPSAIEGRLGKGASFRGDDRNAQASRFGEYAGPARPVDFAVIGQQHQISLAEPCGVFLSCQHVLAHHDPLAQGRQTVERRLFVGRIRSFDDAVDQEPDGATMFKHVPDRFGQQPVALRPIGKADADDSRSTGRRFGPTASARQHRARTGRDLDIEIEQRAIEVRHRRGFAIRLDAPWVADTCLQAGEGVAAFVLQDHGERIVRRLLVMRSVEQPEHSMRGAAAHRRRLRR